MDRRGYLAAVTGSVGAITGVAGCTGLLGDDQPESAVEYELQSDRIYRSEPVRTAAGLVITFTYAIGDTGYRVEDADAEEIMLFPANGWFLKTSVDWLWEGPIPADWRLDPGAFRLLANGDHFDPMSGLPHDIEWESVQGPPVAIPPHFAGGAVPGWNARQGRVNFLFDTIANPDSTYYLEFSPTDPVNGSTEPVFLTSTWGPYDRSDVGSETAADE